MAKTVKEAISKKSLVPEHRHLVEILKSGSPSERKKEAKKQSKELKEYQRG